MPDGKRNVQAGKEEVLKLILRGIYYRHEFARRNSKLVSDAEKVLLQFSLAPERGRSFASANGREFLTDELLALLKAAPENADRLKGLLARFLLKWNVLPMWKSSEPFFPHPNDPKLDFPRLFRLWNSMLRFEMFVVARLLGRPMLFPVIIISEVESGREQIRTWGRLDLEGCRFPLLADLEAPLEVTAAYLKALRLQKDFSRTAESERKERQWGKIPWEDFDGALAAYDAEQQAIQYRKKKSIQLSLYERYGTGRPSKDPLHAAQEQYRRWLRCADRWIRLHSAII